MGYVYGYNQDGFVVVELDDNGRIVGEPQPAAAEDAVPNLIKDYLSGQLVQAQVVAGGEAMQTVAPQQSFQQNVLDRAIDAYYGGGFTLDGLHSALGDRSEVVRLVAQLDPELASLIWGGQIAQSTQNDSSPDEPLSSQPIVIQKNNPREIQPTPAELGSGASERGADQASQSTTASPEATPKTGGDPLLLCDGEFFLQVTDLQVSGCGLPFRFTRTYSHLAIYKGPLGYKWDHTYNLWLREANELQPDGTSLRVVYRSTGSLREDRFVFDAADQGMLWPPPGCFDRLDLTEAGTYRLETPDGSVYSYNPDGYVDTIADRNGNALTFSYDGWQLQKITDTVGRQFLFEYDDLSRLSALNDLVGQRALRFSYGGNGDLEEVDLIALPDLAAGTDYRYVGPDAPADLQHNLIEVISPKGESVLANEYGTSADFMFNRVVRQRSADGEYRYEYGLITGDDIDDAFEPDDRINYPQTYTEVSYPNDHVVQHWFNAQANVVRRREQILTANGFKVLTSDFRYNEDGLLRRETFPDGSGREIIYEQDFFNSDNDPSQAAPTLAQRLRFGDLRTVVVRPEPNSAESLLRIVTQYGRDPNNGDLIQQIGPFYAYATSDQTSIAGQEITKLELAYDSRRNLVLAAHPTVLDADGTNVELAPTRLEYDERGRVIQAVTGNVRTLLRYFDGYRAGVVRERIDDADGAANVAHFEADELARIIRTTDHYGATTDVEFTKFDGVAKVTLPVMLPSGKRPAISMRYDQNRRLVGSHLQILLADGEYHSSRGLDESFSYDAYDRVTKSERRPTSSLEDSVVQEETYRYRPDGLIASQADETGRQDSFRYDERCSLIQIRYAVETADEGSTHYSYDENARLKSITSATGFDTRFERDGFGRVCRVVDADGNIHQAEYDAGGRVVRATLVGRHPELSTIALWSDQRYRFDAIGRCIEKIELVFIPGKNDEPVKAISRLYYDDLGRVVRLLSPEGRECTWAYDGLSRIVEENLAKCVRTSTRYDDPERLITITQENFSTSSSQVEACHCFQRKVQLDNNGMVSSLIDDLGNVYSWSYDSRGLCTMHRDPAGRNLVTEFDAFGYWSSRGVVHADQTAVCTAYRDSAGRLVSIKTPSGDSIGWQYDKLGRVLGVFDSHYHTFYKYDADGNVISEKLPDGIDIRRTYSASGRPNSRIVDTSGYLSTPQLPNYRPHELPKQSYTYTPAGSLSRVWSDTEEISRSFDSRGLCVAEIAGNHAISWSYDLEGNRTSAVWPTGRMLSFGYDELGNLARVSQQQRGSSYPGDSRTAELRPLAELNFCGPRLLSGVLAGQSVAIKMHYDVSGRVMTTSYNSQSAVFSIATLRGSLGEPTIEQRGGMTRYRFDDGHGKLVKSIELGQLPTLDLSSFEPASSLANIPNRANWRTIQNYEADFFSNINDPVRTLSFGLDANGNRLTTFDSGSANQVTSYAVQIDDRYSSVAGNQLLYDLRGSLIHDGDSRFSYDSLGLLASVKSQNDEVTLSRDLLGRVSSLSSNGSALSFVWDGSTIIEWSRGASIEGQIVTASGLGPVHVACRGEEYCGVLDHGNSWLGTFGGAGFAWPRSYDPFGVVWYRQSDDPVPYGFAGSIIVDSNLSDLRLRTYMPKLGRFLQRDPIGIVDGLNRYSYAHHAPGWKIDLNGLASQDIQWGTVAAEAGKSLAVGGGMALLGAGLVAGGIATAPIMLGVGAVMLAVSFAESYQQRSRQAAQAHLDEAGAAVAVSALGDAFGVSGLVEGAYNSDLITGRQLGAAQRSERLGSAVGNLAVLASGAAIKVYAGRQKRAGEHGLTAYQQSYSEKIRNPKSPMTRDWVSDLTGFSGKTTRVRQAMISELVARDLSNMQSPTGRRPAPIYNHSLEPRGIADYQAFGTQIGFEGFEANNSRLALLDTIVHEELHLRWWERGIFNEHHPSVREEHILLSGQKQTVPFEYVVGRYMRLRGWMNRPETPPKLRIPNQPVVPNQSEVSFAPGYPTPWLKP